MGDTLQEDDVLPEIQTQINSEDNDDIISLKSPIILDRPQRMRKKNQRYAQDYIEENLSLEKVKRIKNLERCDSNQFYDREELYCSMCNQNFDSQIKFKKHIRAVHAQNIQNEFNLISLESHEKRNENLNYVEGQSGGVGEKERGIGYIGAFDMPTTMFDLSWEGQVVKEEIIGEAQHRDHHKGGSSRWRPRLKVGGSGNKPEGSCMCEVCGRLFHKYPALKRHLKLGHGPAPTTGSSWSKKSFRCHVCVNAAIKMAVEEGVPATSGPSPLGSSALIDTLRTYPSKMALTEHVREAHTPTSADFDVAFQSADFDVGERDGTSGPDDLQRRLTMGYRPNPREVVAYLKTESMMDGERDSVDDAETADESGAQYICGSCDRRFGTKVSLVTHVEMVHESRDPGSSPSRSKMAAIGGAAGGGPLPCPFCDRTFAKAFHLNRHLASDIHADRLNFRCNSCGVRFADRAELKQHLADFFYHADPGLAKAPKYVCYLCTYPNLLDRAAGASRDLKDIDILASASLIDQGIVERQVHHEDILTLIDPGPDGTRNAVSAIQRLLDPQHKVDGEVESTEDYLNQIAASSSSPHTSTSVDGPTFNGPIKIFKFNKREEYIRHLKKVHPDHYFATFGQPLNSSSSLPPPHLLAGTGNAWSSNAYFDLGAPNTPPQDPSIHDQLLQQADEDGSTDNKFMAAASYTVDNNLVITIGNNVTSVFQVTALPQMGVKVKRRTRHDLGEDVGYACQYCGKCLAYDRSLKQHIKTMHREEWNASASQRIHSRSTNAPGIVVRRSRLDLAFDPGHLCEYCGKTLAYARSLREHIKTVHRNEAGFMSSSIDFDESTLPRSSPRHQAHYGTGGVGRQELDGANENVQSVLQIVENGAVDQHHHLQHHQDQDQYGGEEGKYGSSSSLVGYGRVKRRSRFDLQTPGFLCNFCGKTLAYDRSLKYHIKSVHWRETAAILQEQQQHQQNQLLLSQEGIVQ